MKSSMPLCRGRRQDAIRGHDGWALSPSSTRRCHPHPPQRCQRGNTNFSHHSNAGEGGDVADSTHDQSAVGGSERRQRLADSTHSMSKETPSLPLATTPPAGIQASSNLPHRRKASTKSEGGPVARGKVAGNCHQESPSSTLLGSQTLTLPRRHSQTLIQPEDRGIITSPLCKHNTVQGRMVVGPADAMGSTKQESAMSPHPNSRATVEAHPAFVLPITISKLTMTMKAKNQHLQIQTLVYRLQINHT